MRILSAALPMLAWVFTSMMLFAESNTLQVSSLQAQPNKQAKAADKPPIDFPQFLEVSTNAQRHRESRQVKIEEFLSMSEEPGTLILDTRSTSSYQELHLKGAVHLNFSDFTEEKLSKVIPNKSTRVLIYCNNNFKDDPKAFPRKEISMALNIPTFINLYGYGYKNLYELSSYLSVEDKRVSFEGTEATKLPASQDSDF